MSTLALTYPDYMNAVGYFLGYGSDYTAYDATRQANCDRIVQAGLRQFYFPAQAADGFKGWSFMKPSTGTITTVSGTQAYNMPSDFGVIEGPLSYPSASPGPAVSIIDESDVRVMDSFGTITGRPVYASIRPKTTDGTADQLWQCLLWPTPNIATTLTFKYSISPPKLTVAAPYPYGGIFHHETIKESCLSVAEYEEDDAPGIHTERFGQRLAASIMHDRQSGTHEYFGYNADTSVMGGNW